MAWKGIVEERLHFPLLTVIYHDTLRIMYHPAVLPLISSTIRAVPDRYDGIFLNSTLSLESLGLGPPSLNIITLHNVEAVNSKKYWTSLTDEDIESVKRIPRQRLQSSLPTKKPELMEKRLRSTAIEARPQSRLGK